MYQANHHLPADPVTSPINAAYIVSDKFKPFCDHKIVWDYQSALGCLGELASSFDAIVIGQGVGNTDLVRIQEALKFVHGYTGTTIVEHLSKKVSKDKVHKTKECNVMVCVPKIIGEGVFESYLVVDENCAEMSDHQSGEHVQGALLIEAGRQMFMACATSYELDPEASRKMGVMKFALSEMKITFHNFVFPIETRIELHFLGAKTRDKCADGHCEVKFYQNGQLCCEVFCAAKAFSEKMLSALESRSARQARRSLVAA